MKHDIPAAWESANLASVAVVTSGQSPPGFTYNTSGDGLPFFQGKAEFGEVSPNPVKWCSEPLRVAHPGDVLISVRAPVGPTNLADIECCIGRGLAAITPLGGMPSKFYLYYLRFSVDDLMRQATGTTFQAISGKQLRAHLVLVPPLSEQHRIVEAIESYLTRLGAAVASLERAQKNLKRYRASVLKAAVEGRLVPTEAELARKEERDYEPASELLKRILVERRKKWIEDAAEKARAKAEEKAREAGKPWTPEDDATALAKARKVAEAKYKGPEAPDLSAIAAQAGTTDLPSLPAGWCWVALETLCLSITDGDHAAPPQVPDGIAFLVIGDVRDGAVRFDNARYVPQKYYENLNGARRPQRGDILYTVTGSFGIAVDVDTERPFCVQRHIGILKPAQNMNTRLLSRILASDFVYGQAQATATGTAQKTVGLKNLRRFAIPLPPEREQIRILKAVEAADSVTAHALDAVGRAVLRGQRLRQSILKWAFEGKLVEQDPKDEPASMLLDRIRSETARVKP